MSWVVVLTRISIQIVGLICVFALILLLPGCWVISINPLYEEGGGDLFHKDPDVVFESSVLGSWTVEGDKCTAPVTITSEDSNVYELERKGDGEGCTESDKPSRHQGRLVKLDGHYFFDISPVEHDVCDMCLAEHNIFLMKFDKNSFSLVPIDSDWLKKAITSKKVKLATLGGDTDTITASSKDLKAFCRRYAADKAAFKADANHGDTFLRK